MLTACNTHCSCSMVNTPENPRWTWLWLSIEYWEARGSLVKKRISLLLLWFLIIESPSGSCHSPEEFTFLIPRKSYWNFNVNSNAWWEHRHEGMLVNCEDSRGSWAQSEQWLTTGTKASTQGQSRVLLIREEVVAWGEVRMVGCVSASSWAR